MPIWKRRNIKITSIKCEACRVKDLDVDLQPIDITTKDINYILERIDFDNLPFPFTRLKRKHQEQLIIIGISKEIYNFYECYVCGWFKLVKNK